MKNSRARDKPRVMRGHDENAPPNHPAATRQRAFTDSFASSIAQVPETASTRRSTRIATAKNRAASLEKHGAVREVEVSPRSEKAPNPPGKRADLHDATPAEARARVAKAPEANAAPNAPAATRGRVATGRAKEEPEQVLTHGAERKQVMALEPFMQGCLREMLDTKVKQGVKGYLAVAKTDEKGETTVDESWLGGAPLARNCEPPRDTRSGRVAVALCTYNCGTSNGPRRTLGKTPFALQKDGFAANLSLRFLTRTIPMLVWHTNKVALHARFRGWRKFADAWKERFGMFDLISIALPKVSGVTIDLMKWMKFKDKEMFARWVLATAEYLQCFLRFCGGASNTSAVINASGRQPSSNPWIFFLRELKTIAPEHAVVAFLGGIVDQASLMPHASALINNKVNVGVETLRRGDEALTKIFCALFVDQLNALAVRVAVCYDWKRDRAYAQETMDSFQRKERAQMLQAAQAAEEAKAARAAREAKAARAAYMRAYRARPTGKAASAAYAAKPAVKAARAARDAKPAAKAARAARRAKPAAKAARAAYAAKPAVKARKAAYMRAYHAKPTVKAKKAARDAKPAAKTRRAAYMRAYHAKPTVKAKKAARDAKPAAKTRRAAYMRAYHAKAAAKARRAARDEASDDL